MNHDDKVRTAITAYNQSLARIAAAEAELIRQLTINHPGKGVIFQGNRYSVNGDGSLAVSEVHDVRLD